MSSDMENKALENEVTNSPTPTPSDDEQAINLILSELDPNEPDEEEQTDDTTDDLAEDNPLFSFLKPSLRTKEEIDGDTKKKKRIILISLIAAFAVLATVLVLLLFVFPKEDEDDYEPYTDTSVTLFDKTDSSVKCTIKSVLVQTEKSSVEIYNKDDVLVVKGYEDLTMHALNMGDLETLLTKMVAADDIGEVSNLKEYGLNKPQLTATVVYHDNSEKVFEIGDATPDQKGCYMHEQGSKHVYILDMDSIAVLSQNALDYISTTVFSKPDIEEDDDKNGESDVVLRKMTLSGSMRKDKNFTFRLVTSEDSDSYIYYNYIITEPYLKGANSSYDTELGAFTSLSATGVVKTHPTAADLKEYGLDNPYSLLTFTLAKRTTTSTENSSGDTVSETTHEDLVEHTLRLSKADNDNYYCTIDEKPIVYLVAATDITFAEMEYDDFADTLLFLEDITKMGKFELTMDGKVTTFQLTHIPSIDDNEKNMTVKVDGKTYDTMDFRYLINNFMDISRYTSLKKDVSDLPVKMEFSIYHTGENTPALTVKFHETSGNLCAAVLSNGEKYQVKTSDVEFVIQQCENYLNGKTVLRK